MKTEILNSIHKNFENCISIVTSLCESEIEKIFLLKIIDYIMNRPDRYSLGFIIVPTDTETIEEQEFMTSPYNFQMPDDYGYMCGLRINYLFTHTYIEIFPQKTKEFCNPENALQKIKYRLDFGIYKYSYSNPNEPIRKYCIECDGFDFHNTPIHIKRDNLRMRNLLLLEDYTTIRYLGTEIHNWTQGEIGLFIWNLR